MNQSGHGRLPFRQRLVTVATRLPGGQYVLRPRLSPYANTRVATPDTPATGVHHRTQIQTTQPERPASERLSNVQKYFFILLHAIRCARRAGANEPVGCDQPGCRNMCTILQHAKWCTAGATCRISECIAARKVIHAHFIRCTTRQSCPVCGPIMQQVERRRVLHQTTGEGATQQSVAATGTAVIETNRPDSVPASPQAKLSTLDVGVKPMRTSVEIDNEENLCSICLENKKNTAFLCGHVCCDKCAVPLVNCHICRQVIKLKLKLYMQS